MTTMSFDTFATFRLKPSIRILHEIGQTLDSVQMYDIYRKMNTNLIIKKKPCFLRGTSAYADNITWFEANVHQ